MERAYLEEKLQKYFTAVETITKQGDLRKEERLRLLLEPIVEIYDTASSQGRKHQFVDERCIYLEEELDLSSLELAPASWHIKRNWKLARFRQIDTHEEIISVNCQKFLPRTQTTKTPRAEFTDTSVYQLYKHWLPVLNQERIQSKDLLDQILVCYTIKRAQNGDEKACQKLMKLYMGSAGSKKTHTNVMKKLTWRTKRGDLENDAALSFDTADDDRVSQVPYDDDFRQQANIFTALIIRGLSPKVMLDILRTGRKSQIIPLPRGVTEVFLNYYGEIVPGMVNKYIVFLKNCLNSSQDPTDEQKLIDLIESMDDVMGCLPVQNHEGSRAKMLEYLRSSKGRKLEPDTITKIACSVLAVAANLPSTIAPYFETLLDPYTPINGDISLMIGSEAKRASRILAACYRPQKMGPNNNLTTWLFGGPSSPQFGKLYQALTDHYMKDLSDRVDETEEIDVKIPPGEVLRRMVETERQFTTHHDLEAVADKAGITASDMTFLLDSQRLHTIDELAETYHLTRDQARYKKETLLRKAQSAAKK